MTTHDLDRFRQAQDAGDALIGALAELRAGRKTGHWIWYVLPQLRELGKSELAKRYGIEGAAEVREYLAEPVLRSRLVETVGVVHEQACVRRVPIERLMGSHTDALKCVSCLTLFEHVARAMPEPRHPEVTRLISLAAAVLDEAAQQKLPRCRFTLDALASS